MQLAPCSVGDHFALWLPPSYSAAPRQDPLRRAGTMRDAKPSAVAQTTEKNRHLLLRCCCSDFFFFFTLLKKAWVLAAPSHFRGAISQFGSWGVLLRAIKVRYVYRMFSKICRLSLSGAFGLRSSMKQICLIMDTWTPVCGPKHPHITKQVKTTAVQVKTTTVQVKTTTVQDIPK
jgi:hypothetical protein